jgi:NAD(P)-dependent dehydrogenase (short-subunit alcohol dehydrogenase family)
VRRGLKALPGIRVNAEDPGYTATDLNGYSGTQTVTEGTDAVVALATEDPAAGPAASSAAAALSPSSAPEAPNVACQPPSAGCPRRVSA